MTRAEVIQAGVNMGLLKCDPEDLVHKTTARDICNMRGGVDFYLTNKEWFWCPSDRDGKTLYCIKDSP